MKKRLYIFGGYDGENRLNDFHYFVLADEEAYVHKNSLKQDLMCYVNNESFSDLTIIIDHQGNRNQIYAHRLLLQRCEKFSLLFDEEQTS